MTMRAGLLLLLLFSFGGEYGSAQSTKTGDDVTQFRRRMAGLSPGQRMSHTRQFGTKLVEQSRFAEARPLLQAALTTARQAHLDFYAAQFCIQLGGMESIAGNHSRSVNYHLQALAILRAIHAYDKQIQVCDDISGEYRILQNKAKQKEYGDLVTQLAKAYRTTDLLVRVYSVQADKAAERGNLDSTLIFYRKCLTVLRAVRQWGNFFSYLDGYGVALGQAGRYREAEQTFRRCLVYAYKQGDKRRELYEYMHLPEPLLHLGRIDEAQRYAKLALSRIERDPERQNEHRIEVYGLLTRMAEARGQFRQALVFERLRNQYAAEEQSAEKNRQVAEVESRFQVAQKQARIDQLASDNRRQLDQIGWQASGLITLLALLGVALWQYRVIRRVNARMLSTNQTIFENNRQISEQADTLTVLMRELHHRVKNNLAIVSSLLRMQSRRLDDPQAVQAVQDGQRRVEAISLIHQQFYQTENLAEVAIKAYVTELTEGLLIGYGFDPDSFDCRIDVADILLDVEVAVPLGLLLNEVLTNAFKYAYNTPSSPNVPTEGSPDRTTKGRATKGSDTASPTRPALLVRLQPDPKGGLVVEVQDNGPGLDGPGLDGPGLEGPGLEGPGLQGSGPSSPGMPPTAPAGRNQSFGQRLIRELTGQLGGEMTLTNRQGTYFRLWIPDQD